MNAASDAGDDNERNPLMPVNSVHLRRQQVQRHGEDQIDHQ
jgi:hypothetical protein